MWVIAQNFRFETSAHVVVSFTQTASLRPFLVIFDSRSYYNGSNFRSSTDPAVSLGVTTSVSEVLVAFSGQNWSVFSVSRLTWCCFGPEWQGV